jgi:tetratricopeptide (TPR) repeat protein
MHDAKAIRHYEEGRALHEKGQLALSERAYRKAIKLNHDFVPAHNNLGNVLVDRGRPQEAASAYSRALKLSPGHPMLLNNLGNALHLLGDYERAVHWITKAIVNDPDYSDAYNNLGNALGRLGKFKDAVENYDKAIELNPDVPESHFNRGHALTDLGDIDEAVKSYDKAIELNPGYAQAHYNRGIALEELGETVQAKGSYNEAIRLKPDAAVIHRHLSGVKHYETVDSQIELMENLLERLRPNNPDRVHLYFALAKAYSDLGEFDHSFEHLTEANRLRKKHLKYKIHDDQKLATTIKKTFNVELVDLDRLNASDSSLIPLFIVGMPRSGTSLVEQILASHSEVHGAGELECVNKILRPFLSSLDNKTRKIDSKKNFQKTISTLRDSYLETLSGLNVAEAFIVDKMPLNFLWVGYILQAFPEAKVIHTTREARATCWSIYKQYFSSTGNGYAYDLKDIAAFYKLYVDLMGFWNEQYPGRIYDLCYEYLTEDQERNIRKLLAYCDLKWEPQCLEFHKTKRVVKTASATQVRQRMYQGSSDAWRQYADHLEALISNLSN